MNLKNQPLNEAHQWRPLMETNVANTYINAMEYRVFYNYTWFATNINNYKQTLTTIRVNIRVNKIIRVN